jgi:lipopolysaccharide transport system permease protein
VILTGDSARYLRTHWLLLWRVTRNELWSRYAGSVLGFGWVILSPLLILGIYALIYLEIFHVQVPSLTSGEYVLYIFSGLVPYLATGEALSHGVSSVVSSRSILSSTAFPIDLVPVKAVLTSQGTMVVGIAVIIIGMAATGHVHPTVLLVPVIWVFQVLFLIGVNWFSSLLNIVFRDLQNLITAILMLMLVASPIAYTPDMVPSQLRALIVLNPFAYFVIAYQSLIVLGEVPPPQDLAVIATVSLTVFVLGSRFFPAAKHAFLDYF